MHRLPLLVSLIFCGLCAQPLVADLGNQGAWGDLGDGTFKNPILPGDFSDPDVIRVGSDYYLITSTFQYSPGMAVMHSKDLVNWQYLGGCVADLTQMGPELNWDRMNRYGRGIYAGTIRFHAGKFWVFWTTLDEGVFMTTATNPAGPWAPVTRVWASQGWDDPAPFWDDDGQAYLVLSNPVNRTESLGRWVPHLFKMSPDGASIDVASARVLDPFSTSEGNKLYKINGTYFLFHNEYYPEPNRVRVGVMMRAKSLAGPWEKKVILADSPDHYDRQPNQGGLVDTPSGDWWFITQQGRGENGADYRWAHRADRDTASPHPMDNTGTYDGRPSHLLPVTWVDGWPIPGVIDRNGAGNLVWSARKPVAGFPAQRPQTSDDFATAKLAPQWEWNYQPRAAKWSLTARPGWLRLEAFKPLSPDDFFKAGNTLTQRVMGTGGGEIVVKADVGGLADGQFAGLALFWKSAAQLGVAQQDGVRRIEWRLDGTVAAGPLITQRDVWLKAVLAPDGTARFSFSLDRIHFTELGKTFTLGWHHYRGARIALFSFNERGEAGYADFDSFDYTVR